MICARGSGSWFCGGGWLRRFDGSGLLHGSAAMEEPRSDKDRGENEGGDDRKRKIIKFGQRQQGRALERWLNEVVARPGGCAADRDGLDVDRWLGGG